jgi:hypothetical protein
MKSYEDPALGELERRRGRWRRDMELGFETVPLVLVGGRSGPDPEAVTMARGSVGRLPAWRELVGPALRDHRSNGTDVPVDAELWADVMSAYVAVLRIDGAMTVEWGMNVAWDEEHTLAARMRDGELVELNGSVLAP